MITYKQLISAFESFADAHFILKNFGNGELWQINDHDQNTPFEYPLMYVVDVPSSPSSNSWIYAFRIYFVSRIEAPKDRDGNPIYFEYTSEKSAMISCAQDFLSYWVQDVNYKMTIEQSLGVTTFIDAQEDGVTGCYVDIRFVVPFSYDSCVIPMSGVTPPPSSNVKIYINDVLYYTLPPGTELPLNVIDTNGDPVDATIIGNNIVVPLSGGSINIDINGVPFLADQTTDVDIPVKKSDGTTNTGSKVGANWQIGDVTLTHNGNAITPNKSETSKAIITRYENGTQIGTPTTDTEGSLIVEIPDPVSGGVEAIGYIVDDDFSTVANLDDYTPTITGSVAYNLDGGYLKITGTPASISPISTLLRHDYGIGLENYGMETTFIVKSVPATNASFVICIEDMNGGSTTVRKELFYYYINTAVPASSGRVFRQRNNVTIVGAYIGTVITPVVDHKYRFSLLYRINTITVIIEDITPGFEAVGYMTTQFTFANTTGDLTPRSSNLSIGTGGGEYWVENFRIKSFELKNVDILFIHDSIGAGYCTDFFQQRWIDLVKQNRPELTITKSGGQGDWAGNAVNKMSEYALINAGKVRIHLGTNDVVTSGASNARANYNAMVNGLIALGYTEFVHFTALPRLGATAINTFNNTMISDWGSQVGHTVVNWNPTFNDGSNNLLPLYASTDNIHPNILGNYRMMQIALPYFT
jgi:hypothetical protein